MHQLLNPSASQARLHRRPLWMLAALAFGMSPLMSWLLSSPLADANTWLASVFQLGPEDRETIHLTRLLLRVVLPTCLLLLLLRFTSLGRWLVVTPLLLAPLLVEDALFLLHVSDEFSLYVLRGNGVFHGFLRGAPGNVALHCLFMSALLLAGITAWHRSPALKRGLTKTVGWWLREI